jgi:hypothetical protein
MDLRLFGRVIWRFRLIVGVGLVAAVMLATFSYVKVSFAHGLSLRYRSEEQWVSYTRLFVTQPGFGWGSSVVNPKATNDAGSQANTLGVQQASENRLSALANLYASLVDSDPVLALIRQRGPLHGMVQAAALPVVQGSDAVLPIIQIAGIAPSPKASVDLSANAADALRTFIAGQQSKNGIAPSERIVLQLVNKASGTKVFAARKKTLPIVVFLTVALAVIALAFMLENLRPRIRVASETRAAPAQLPEKRVGQTAS